MKILVLGCSKHKGEYEGTPYDYSKIYCIARREESEKSHGKAGIDMRALPEVYSKASAIDYGNGRLCEVETEMVALGGGNARETVVSITALPVASISK